MLLLLLSLIKKLIKMNKNELAKDFIGGSLIATAISLVAGLVTGVIMYFVKEFQFFLRPENAHFTEYNTPHYIYNSLVIQGFQDPLTIIVFIIPYILMVGVLVLLYKSGEYRD